MGLLQDGKWVDQWYDTKSTGGKFVRTVTQFRNWITPDGQAGPTGEGGFKAESGRYHLYISLACPWASRTLIMRKLKGLEDHISQSIVHPLMLENGWTFADGSGVIKDSLFNSDYLYQVYLKADPHYSGRVTVPVLWDKETNTIVSNESAEIMRMFNSAFNDITGNYDDCYPANLQADIDAMNDFVYPNINNGVYKAVFSTSQAVYEKEVKNLFAALDKLEEHLADKDYLVGNQLTEADIRLFTTLVRFDPVYFGHFKCNIKALVDYPNLWNYTKRLYNHAGIAETVDFDHIKQHYYGSHKTINPTGIVPVGPDFDWTLEN
ncbi:TPA: glutathione S-transferase family protein [Streptococcus suis]|uniref:glutathione S-transferase family protein n=1 Tax=Streptococcus suis TaxID=1307 RepID=UPI000CF3BE20|nr:glutathione S-transferase family protein [Streptococcus suis]HEL1985087.1 glutathione S-transferase family protein [Streptococcus suis]HEL9642657.1 glutathione S-transferase family protein [Streptococcus suis]HEM4765897.1 glutathione S-transferase family protein [Streptococcus suis]HEM4855571.1 glutathione S-transferase family protein [Streptococcus suis]HEM4973965.1 glutathione S-transferase family protein [Streptococcus suis]